MKKYKNIVILTAKGGNTTVPNKNLIPILGVPVMLYPLRAAKMSYRVDKIYVTTEDKMIANLSIKEDVEVIDRPLDLSTNTSQHKDVIKHAVEYIIDIHPEVENVMVLIGNTVMVTSQIIDHAFELLDTCDCDSVATVWKAQDDHPYRALQVNDEGYMSSFMNSATTSNRQDYPDVYFYDQGVWAFNKECAIKQEGPVPWVWLGKKCKMIERPWVTGRDIHSWIDISASAWYLNSIQVNEFFDYKDI